MCENQKAGEIETVEDLEIRYPQLVTKIRDEEIEEIASWPIEKVRLKFPALVQRIGKGIGLGKGGSDLSVPGFLLEESEEDPFSQGTLRHFGNLKRVTGLKLPHVLPFDDPFTRAALENYILRAEGGGDQSRADAAKEALAKCK